MRVRVPGAFCLDPLGFPGISVGSNSGRSQSSRATELLPYAARAGRYHSYRAKELKRVKLLKSYVETIAIPGAQRAIEPMSSFAKMPMRERSAEVSRAGRAPVYIF